MSEDVVNAFVAAYAREFDYYQTVARICSQRIESLLAANGIRAMVTHRGKRPIKLKTKLLQREKQTPYENADAIRDDIADLAGVRIALYFPADSVRVEKLLHSTFDVEHMRRFPEDKIEDRRLAGKKFDGYHACHFRLRLQESQLDDEKSYADARIEVQVGSVLMHGWAEVEHDLVYKPESGELSEDELAILDELNGLVIAGEIALERLQRALERRLSETSAKFESHYELAAFLDKWARSITPNKKISMGRIDVLWELLRKGGRQSPESVNQLLSALEIGDEKEEALSDKLIDLILAQNPSLYQSYPSLQEHFFVSPAFGEASGRSRDRSTAIGHFLSAWIVLERAAKIFSGSDPTIPRQPMISAIRRLLEEIGASDSSKLAIERARRVRNELVHGIEVPPPAFLDSASSDVHSVLEQLADSPAEGARRAYQLAIHPLQNE